MKGYTLNGELVYVDTDKGEIKIKEQGIGDTLIVEIGDYAPKGMGGWVDFLGHDVECVIIDGKLTQMSELVKE